MRNLKLTIEYDGTNYCGWQSQKNGVAIQDVLEGVLARITGERIRVVGSGRTDAGVHAIGQVAHVHLSSPLPVKNILKGMNSLLPWDIAIKKIEEVDESFHARYDATSKVYLYRICNQSTRSPLEYRYSWMLSRPLKIEAMAEALGFVRGTHDFTSFSAAETGVKGRERTVKRATIDVKLSGVIELEMEANGFLRHMVRAIVGTLVEVGKGKLNPSCMEEILLARNRSLAGPTAPPQGLFLKEVKYGKGGGE
jgi:tRNA pseudouridine38-40 synthase